MALTEALEKHPLKYGGYIFIFQGLIHTLILFICPRTMRPTMDHREKGIARCGDPGLCPGLPPLSGLEMTNKGVTKRRFDNGCLY